LLVHDGGRFFLADVLTGSMAFLSDRFLFVALTKVNGVGAV